MVNPKSSIGWMRLPLTQALLVGVLLALGQECSAQVARYQPQTSTISPYLNLNQFNFGGVPNYYALVRPQLQQQQFNRQQQLLNTSQGRVIYRLQNDVQRGLTPASATGSGSWFMAPGTQAKFLDSSHFYPEPNFRGIRR